ncbi:ferredoxin reductase family protein [Arhodomonas sp. SL1]|uniref:ferredoxin reductase family protein n=1 Tax=Arhodomonas sp. SL1 TaxID=3425691 RepID=UPI003F88362C
MQAYPVAVALVVAVWLTPGVAAVLLESRLPEGAADWLRVSGRLAGILGLSGLLVNTALSARIPGLDRWFGGLTRMWRRHHYLGAASFLLLLAHPLLLAWAALPVSVDAAVDRLFPAWSNGALWAGWAALLAMMVFLAPSFAFFGRPDYQRWKALHLLAGVAVVCSLPHAIGLAGALPKPAAIAIWGVLGVLAMAGFLYRAVLSRWVARRPYRVTEVTALTEDVAELTLAPEGRPMRYRAGQFVYLAHQSPTLGAGYNQQHPYTLSSAPEEDVLRIGVKALGDLSTALLHTPPGTPMTVEGPYGDLFPEALEGRSQLWLAGGIGITPFVARARSLRVAGVVAAPVMLVYCAENTARAYYLEELAAVAATVKGFDVRGHLFEEEGPLTAVFLDGVCPDWREREVIFCGPAGMHDHCWRLLRREGVRHWRTEEFDLL